MKIFVINLDSRADRLDFMSKQLQGLEWERFSAVNGYNLDLKSVFDQGFAPLMEWEDPMTGRTHTFTDIAAMMSHFKVWEKCVELNEPVLVLEDDAELIGKLDISEINNLINVVDFVFLDYREMFPDRITDFSSRFFIPYYPYLTSAYVITPRLANKFISSAYKTNLIPVDEFFSSALGVNYFETCLSNKIGIRDMFVNFQKKINNITPIRALAYKDKVFKQVPRSVLGSDIEAGKRINVSTTTHVLTVGTDIDRLHLLYKTAGKYNISFKNLGEGVEWKGGSPKGPGCGQKLNLVKQEIAQYNSDDIVLFVDGYDVIFNDSLDTIVSRFKEFKCDILIGAERVCWPDKSLSSLFTSHTDYKYPNSGLYIGYAGKIKKMLEADILDAEDDQLYIQKFIISNNDINIQLDKECYIFQNHGLCDQDVEIASNGQLRNKSTKCRPCLLHGNGSSVEKEKFFKFVQTLLLYTPPVNKKSQEVYKLSLGDIGYTNKIESEFKGIIKYKTSDTYSATVVGNEILEMEFLSPDMCHKLIDLAEQSGNWESMYGDKFPGQEIRIRKISIDLFNEMEANFMEICRPVIEKHWFPTYLYGLRDAFIIKYSPDTQKDLKCHNDASMVSGMIKLNDTYTGGDTYFYRQKYSNINTKQGNIILWPSQVTHGHEGREVTSGTKYNLVIWTRRMKDDINF